MVYEGAGRDANGYPTMPSAVISIPVDKEAVVKRGLVAAKDTADIVDNIVVDLRNTNTYQSKGYLSLGEILMLDIVATNAANGWLTPSDLLGDHRRRGLPRRPDPIYAVHRHGSPARADHSGWPARTHRPCV